MTPSPRGKGCINRQREGLVAVITLGCNYSPQLVSLIDSGRVDVNWIKLSRKEILHEELRVARPLRPVLAHIYPRAGLPDFSHTNWDQLNREIEECGSPHIGIHFSSVAADWNEPVMEAEVIERMTAHVALWCAKIRVPVLIENPSYYGFQGAFRCATSPEMIAAVCEETSAELLLDLAHARVAAVHRGENVIDYLERMPLAAVREIHVCGPKVHPETGYLMDAHQEMAESDYKILNWTLARTLPSILTLEYSGTGPKMEAQSDIHALERQLIRLKEVVQKVQF